MSKVLGILLGLVLAATGVFLFVWLLWWLWTREQGTVEEIEIDVNLPLPEDMPDAERSKALVETQPAPLRAEAKGTPAPPADDLKRIEGIGPKIARVLHDAGIKSFAGLAEMQVERIRTILEEEDPRLTRLADPSSWPEQAALAASGNWEGLAALQGKLKGGRRS